jgi:hypothetical protein
VAEQVVGGVAEQGRSQALLELDPESVTPSVGLLQELLALKGGLPPDRLRRLRRLVDRVVRELTSSPGPSAAAAWPGLGGGPGSRLWRRPAGRSLTS